MLDDLLSIFGLGGHIQGRPYNEAISHNLELRSQEMYQQYWTDQPYLRFNKLGDTQLRGRGEPQRTLEKPKLKYTGLPHVCHSCGAGGADVFEVNKNNHIICTYCDSNYGEQ